MPVRPLRLQGITADDLETRKREAVVVVRNLRARNVTKNVGLAATGGAWTRAPQRLQIEKRFATIVPHDAEFTANLLNVGRLKAHLGSEANTTSITRAMLALERWIGRLLANTFGAPPGYARNNAAKPPYLRTH
jgi:hypothetical protein